MMCLNARIKFFAFGCTICAAARDECAGCWSHGVRSEEKRGDFFSLFFSGRYRLWSSTPLVGVDKIKGWSSRECAMTRWWKLPEGDGKVCVDSRSKGGKHKRWNEWWAMLRDVKGLLLIVLLRSTSTLPLLSNNSHQRPLVLGRKKTTLQQ